MFEFLSRLVVRRDRVIVGVSVGLVVGAAWYGLGVFGDLNSQTDLSLPGSESGAVAELISEHFDQSATPLVVLFSAKDDGVAATDEAFMEESERLLATLAPSEQIQSYASTGQSAFVSRDGRQGFALVDMKMDRAGVVEAVEAFEAGQSSDLLAVDFGGQDLTEHQMMRRVELDLIRAEMISLPIVLLLLLFFFRSVVAASLPVIMGLCTIVGGMAMTRLLAQAVVIDQYAVNVITILGLGLSIDYSLLMVNRFREERDLGLSVVSAVGKTVMTAGRTIFFSGLTVMSCLLALTVFPMDFLRSVGLGAASALVVAVGSSLIVLPALLLVLGDSLNRWPLPGRKSHKGDVSEHSIWYRTGQFTLAHPIITLMVTVCLIAVVAWPVRQMEFTGFDYRSLPQGTSSRQVAQSLAENFDGQGEQLRVLYHLSEADSPEGLVLIYQLMAEVGKVEGVESVLGPVPSEALLSPEMYEQLAQAGRLPAEAQQLWSELYRHDYVLVTALMAEGADRASQSTAVDAIRNLEINGQHPMVGGMAAMLTDVLDMLVAKLPIAAGLMAGAMFVLFLLLLQSVVIPLKTILINAVALMGSFGVLVLVFEHGLGSDWLWFSVTGGLQPTIPILIFAVAFGLSMDYAAFLYGRMHEEYVALRDNDQAVLHALDKTGTIITAAAVLLFAVVGAFMSSSVPILQQVGVGLGVAVIIDAFIVRMFLVPSIMKLLGHWNWWAPSFLKRWQIRHE